ncbi:MAG: acetate--CoA ligase, partial [Candidatus Puniceispirillaceae bacterium]
ACTRIGAIHSVVFGGFSPDALAGRIQDCQSNCVITADEGVRGGRVIPLKANTDKALQSCPDCTTCFVIRRTGASVNWEEGRDIWYHDALAAASPDCPPEEMNAEDPMFILYTSGSTGKPKGVLHTTGGYMVYASMTHHYVFDYQDGDIYWCTADVGWVTGHSYILYGPLANGATTLMFEGVPTYPDSGRFWQVVEKHKVSIFYTAPTAIRALMREGDGPVKKWDKSSLRLLGSVGEPINPEAWMWYHEVVGEARCPIVDTWWQTETGWPIAANCTGVELLPVKPGSSGPAVPSWDVQVLDEGGHPAAPGDIGSIVVKLPMPPGSLPSLWNNDQRFIDSYMAAFPGYYETGDAGYIDEDGYIFVMSRTDDIINVAGHRLSTGGMEEVLAGHPDVAECAVIGINDALKGQIPLGFIVLKSGVARAGADIISEIVAKVRAEIGPVAAFKQAVIVQRLPKTRSGKILRATMQKIVNKEEYPMPATIDDPVILDEITATLEAVGMI